MSSRNGLTIAGLAVAGAAGYYLYSAGGDPKVAEKQLEADASKASAKVRSELPGRTKEAEKTAQSYEKKGEALATSAGKKFDEAFADTKSKLAQTKEQAESYRKDAAKELNKDIDKFDKTVEKKTAEAKSGLSSWFGGK